MAEELAEHIQEEGEVVVEARVVHGANRSCWASQTYGDCVSIWNFNKHHIGSKRARLNFYGGYIHTVQLLLTY